jgi:hypothetical protein
MHGLPPFLFQPQKTLIASMAREQFNNSLSSSAFEFTVYSTARPPRGSRQFGKSVDLGMVQKRRTGDFEQTLANANRLCFADIGRHTTGTGMTQSK